MLSSKAAHTSLWAQVLIEQVVKPVFPRLPPRGRPYLLAGTLFAVVSALMYIGNAALLRAGLPWGLVALLVVVAAANLWGVRPAGLVLALCALYGALVVPHLAPPPSGPPPTLEALWRVLLVRSLVFVACGAVTLWLTGRARQMQEKAETRRGVVTALRAMILPDALASVPGYDVSGLYKPLRREEEVGGDFYDVFPMGEGCFGVLMGDVMGKGKEAASAIAFLRCSARAFGGGDCSPARVMAHLNALIETQEHTFGTATLFFGCLDAEAGLLRYANAGHEMPLLRRTDGGEECLDVTGPLLGVGSGVAYQERDVALECGDALLLMTDGVTEARNEWGDFLGSDGVWRRLRAALRAPSTGEALAVLNTALADYIGSNHRDDIAMVLLRRTAVVPSSIVAPARMCVGGV